MDEPGVLIRPSLRFPGKPPGPCTARALALQANASRGLGRHHAPVMSSNWADAMAAAEANASRGSHRTKAYEWMGHALARTTFCLTPPGDTGVNSRLYSAVAAGCVPVLPWDASIGAFPWAADYDSFRVRVSARAFVGDPHAVITRLREMPADELLRRQRALAEHAADLLFDAPASRVGTHFLYAAMTCRKRLIKSAPPRKP